MLFHHAVDGRDLIADGSGAFELQRLGGLLHLLAQARDDGFGAAIQELAQIVDHLPVAGLVNAPDARRGAQLDVVVQAGAGILAGDLAVAGEIGEDAPQHVERLVHGPHAGVGAEVARAVVDHLARDGDFGKGVRPVYLDVGVAFVVLEAHVVTRAVLFDQVHLEDERLEFRADHDPLDVGDVFDQLAGLKVLVAGRVEVRAHPVAQIDGLADVNDLAGAVFHDVTAGLVGQGIQDLPDVFGNLSHKPILSQAVKKLSSTQN